MYAETDIYSDLVEEVSYRPIKIVGEFRCGDVDPSICTVGHLNQVSEM